MKSFGVPAGAGHAYLLMNSLTGKEVIVRLVAPDGTYVAEFPVNTPYFEFEIKGNTSKVEVIGDVDIFETVFVK